MRSKHGFETTPTRSLLMSRIKSNDTQPELLLRRKLWSLGYRYRKNYSKLPGKPDVAFIRYHVAIFVDGEFWHGYKWKEKKARIQSNSHYWIQKIERNMARDRNNTLSLSRLGWTVIRFWAHEVQENPDSCVNEILKSLSNGLNLKD